MSNIIDTNASPVQNPQPNEGIPQTPPPGAYQNWQQTPPPQQMPPKPQPAPAKDFSPWAIISLISGILNFKYAPLGAIVALITGYIARKEIKKSDGALEGQGLATAGIVLGWVGIFFSILLLVLFTLIVVGLISGTPILFGSLFEWLGSHKMLP